MTTTDSDKHSSHCVKCAICQCRCCIKKRSKCSHLKRTSLHARIQSNNHQRRCLLILVRHGMSEDEVEKRYSGWNDSDLSNLGEQQMHRTGQALHQAHLSIDICFTSLLKRAIKSLFIIQEETDHLWTSVCNIWRLNDRMLGNLTSFQRDRAQALFGQNQIKQWLTQPHLAPPPLEQSNILHPRFAYKYRHIYSIVPSTETIADVRKRLLPFVYDQLFNSLYLGQNILLVTHEDIIKTIIRLLNNFTVDEFDDQPIPIGVPLVLEFSLDTNELCNGYYLSSSVLNSNTNDQQHWFPTGFDNEQMNATKELPIHSKALNIRSNALQQRSDVVTECSSIDSLHLSTDTKHTRDILDSEMSISLHNQQQQKPGFAMLPTADIAFYELATPHPLNQNDSMIDEDGEAFIASNFRSPIEEK